MCNKNVGQQLVGLHKWEYKWLYKKAYNNRLSVTNDYDCILLMLLESSKNGRLEVTQFSVSTTSGTVSVIQRDVKCNTSRLTAPGSIFSLAERTEVDL